MTTPLLVTSAEAATILSVSEKRVRDLANDGVLEKRYVGSRNYRITYESLERYVASLSQDPVAS